MWGVPGASKGEWRLPMEACRTTGSGDAGTGAGGGALGRSAGSSLGPYGSGGFFYESGGGGGYYCFEGGGGSYRGAKASRLDAIKVGLPARPVGTAHRHGPPARPAGTARRHHAARSHWRSPRPARLQVDEALSAKGTAIFLLQDNPKKKNTKSWERYEGYKAATTVPPTPPAAPRVQVEERKGGPSAARRR